jgi:hypothetical protein
LECSYFFFWHVGMLLLNLTFVFYSSLR